MIFARTAYDWQCCTHAFPQRMLLARAALASLRPPVLPLRRRLSRAMSTKEAIVSVTEVHATRWLRCALRARHL